MMSDRTRQDRKTAGDRSRANQNRGGVYMIEGEPLTMVQIAERLGIAKSAANARMRKARGAPGPVTWAELRG